MKTFIFGATGFLGYYTTLAFLKKNIPVGTTLRESNSEVEKYFPKGVEIEKRNFDIFEASEKEIANILKGYDSVVYSVGPDDRVTPEAPAYDFFYEKLVKQTLKILKACKLANVKRCTIMSSYFAYFDRQYNGALSKNHPYISARVQQADLCIKQGGKDNIDVMILELPYIFGSMPTRTPLWKDVFLDKFENMKTVFFPKGGTVMVHVKDVASATVGATLYGKHGEKYPIGVENMKFKTMIELMYKYLEIEKKVKTTPTFLAYLVGLGVKKKAQKEGKEGGLDYAKLMTDILSKDLYYEEKVVKDVEGKLKFKYSFCIKKGIEVAMKSCYPDKFPDFNPSDQIKDEIEA